jgi:hypothetical protein
MESTATPATATPIPIRTLRGTPGAPRPAIARPRISRPGKSVFSCGFCSSSRIGAVAPPQIQFSSGAVAKTVGQSENASTVDGGRSASGCSSATRMYGRAISAATETKTRIPATVATTRLRSSGRRPRRIQITAATAPARHSP